MPELFVACTDLSALSTYFYKIAIFLFLQASKPLSLQAFNLPRRVTRSANNNCARGGEGRERGAYRVQKRLGPAVMLNICADREDPV